MTDLVDRLETLVRHGRDQGMKMNDVEDAAREIKRLRGVAQQPCNCGVMCQNLGKEAGCRYMQPARERLRTLVDIVWNDATDSSAVPSTKWADKLIDQVFGPDAAQPPAAPVRRACDACPTPDECAADRCKIYPNMPQKLTAPVDPVTATVKRAHELLDAVEAADASHSRLSAETSGQEG